jgi:general secretion pathway protein J
MICAPRHPVRNGYTLVELLVGLVILGMTASMLLAALSATGRFSARAKAQETGADQIAAAQMALRGRIERLRAVPRLDSNTAIVDVRGGTNDFAFFAPPVDSESPDMLQRYRLLTTATGDMILYAAHGLDDRIDLNAKDLIGWRPTLLLSNVAAMTISYFGSDPITGEQRWQTAYTDRQQPPDLVKIHVDFAAGDKRIWPDLIIRPRATANTACRISALTGRGAGQT